jgi:transcriptional regulator with XRE-family HTH domain
MQVLNIDGEALSTARQIARLSQRELALAAGISFQFLNDLERGRRGTKAATREALAAACEVPVSEIERWYDKADRPREERKAA